MKFKTYINRSLLLFVLFMSSNTYCQSVFQILTSKENTSQHITTIDHASTNGNPNAIIVVTPEYGRYINAPIGVWYSGDKWKIYTEDKSALPLSTKFNVMVMEPGATAFKVSMPTGLPQNWMELKKMPENSVFLTTHVYNSGGYNVSPVGVYQTNGKTILYNEMDKNIPKGMEFNVILASKLPKGEATIHRNQSTDNHISPISNAKTENKLVFSTVSLEVPGIYNRRNTGVWWNGTQWTIYNQGLDKMAKNVLFNVYMVDKPIFWVPPIVIPPLQINEIVKTKNNVNLPLTTGASNIRYVVRGGEAVYQNDIILGPAANVLFDQPPSHPVRPDFKVKYDRGNYGDISSQSQALTAVGGEGWEDYKWRFGIIPFRFEPSDGWTIAEQRTIMNHLEDLDRRTNLTLSPWGGESDYINFVKRDGFLAGSGGGGSSPVGRCGGKQDIKLGGDSYRTVVHETLHSAGFWHEQSRPDRDRYVAIDLSNVDEDKKHNFDKHTNSRVLGPYDLMSIMHYSAGAFGNGSTTITAPDGSSLAMSGSRLSGLDIDGVNLFYEEDFNSLTTPPLNSSRRIDVVVGRFEAKSGSDGCGEVEFNCKMEIGEGHTWQEWNTSSGALRREFGDVDGRLIRPNWRHSMNISLGASTAKVIIRMMEADSGFCFSDDWVDINPMNDKMMELHLKIDLAGGEVYLWDYKNDVQTDYVGQVNTDIPLQGFETRDNDNDESIPGHILFRIDVRNP